MKNYYEILEVNKKASKEVIEKAYKVLAKKYHPDTYSGNKKNYSEQKMKDINEAYNILSDDILREKYDNEIEKEIEKENYIRAQNYNRQFNERNNTSNMYNNVGQQKQAEEIKRQRNENLGTYRGIIDLCKELKEIIKNKPKREEIKEITKKDLLAIFLTIITLIILGIILWFIPFTNGWMRQLIFENPLISWIFT